MWRWGRADGVCPHFYEANASGPGDVEGSWQTNSRAEAIGHLTVSNVILRFPFRADWIDELSAFDFLERVIFDCERSVQASAALANVTHSLPGHRPFSVWVFDYVGRAKPAFLDAPSLGKRLRWFDCPEIDGSEKFPTIGGYGRPV